MNEHGWQSPFEHIPWEPCGGLERTPDLGSVRLVGNISSATSSLGNNSEVTYCINHSLLIYVMGTKSPPPLLHRFAVRINE